MAAVSSTPTGATALTPPSSSHGDAMWDVPGMQSEKTAQDNHNESHLDESWRGPVNPQNGNALSFSYAQTARKMHSTDNLNMLKRDKSGDGNAGLAPALALESRQGQINLSEDAAPGKQNGSEERQRHVQQALGIEYSEEDSKWIHRDKLAKIENEELQAAGFIIPRVRASSKQRRSRGQNSIDVDNQHQNRQRHDSAIMDQVGEEESSTPHWDLRTPEEIAEEEANTYFCSQGVKGGTKIPVAKISPAPIPQDYLDRGSPSVRRIESMDGDTIAYTKTRSRSASTSTRDFEVVQNGNRSAATAKRSVTEGSPKKTTVRKTSTASKTSTTPSRPKTRSGPIRDASGTRPSTRSGELSSVSKQPEGDPPWVFDSYKPDPRLPPDQQLIPTVAKRLQQEKWEKEGKFGDAYDKEFRPLNDHEFLRPQSKEPLPAEEDLPQAEDWPLKPGNTKSPKQGSYSTMPKISDKPPVSTAANAKPPEPQPMPQPQDVEPTTQAEEKAEKKAGCGCCVIM